MDDNITKDVDKYREDELREEEKTTTEVEAPMEISLVELIYGTLFRPAETFRQVGRKPPLFKSFLIFSLVIVLNLFLSLSLTPHTLLQSGLGDLATETLSGMMPFFAIIGTVIAYIAWLLMAGTLQIFAEIFEGKGSALGTLSVLGLIQLPRIVLIPFEVAGTLLDSSRAASFFVVLGSLLYLGWWVYLMVIGIKEVHRLTIGKTLAVLGIPVFFAGLAMVVITIAGVGVFVPLVDIISQ